MATLSAGFPSAGQGRDQGRVHCQLCPIVQGESMRDDLDPPVVKPAGCCDIEVCDEDVCPHSGASFSAYPCCCPF